MRMAWTPHKQSEAQAPQLPAEQEPVPSPGAQEYRRRGAVLRRLLAFSDWLVLIASLFAVTAASASTEVGTLFWATLLSPTWVLVVKLHGLYDNDHRRIRHSTLDELPSLISASAVGVLVLDGLLALSPVGPLSPASAIAIGVGTLGGSFVLRGTLRSLWHRLTPVGTGIVIGPAAAVDVVARRVAIHPETRLSLVGYLSSQAEPAANELPRLGSVADLARTAEEHEIERVVVTEGEMSEPATERLIVDCKAAGLALTFLPQHYGLLGPGVELNRLAELPVLDFRFSDPPRSTMAMKRAMDIFISAGVLLLLSPILALIAVAILLDTGRPVLFRQRRAGEDGKPFTMLKFRTMVVDAEQRLAGADRRRQPRPARLQDPRRPPRHPGRPLPAADSASTSCRRCSTSCAATCRWSGRDRRRWRSSPFMTSASAAGWR